MRIAALVLLSLATTACEGYHFPGPDAGTGTVHGQVIGLGCGGPVIPAQGSPCPAKAIPACPSLPPLSCGGDPGLISAFELVFTNGSTSRIATTDDAGAYTIDLPVGTWRVTAGKYGHILDGPLSVAVSTGSTLEADYRVDTGMRAAA